MKEISHIMACFESVVAIWFWIKREDEKARTWGIMAIIQFELGRA